MFALIRPPYWRLRKSIFLRADCVETVRTFPYCDSLQTWDSLSLAKSSMSPIAPYVLTISWVPFFSSFFILDMLPTLLQDIIGSAWACLLAGSDLLNKMIESIYFSWMAVDGRIPRLRGSVVKSTTLGWRIKCFFITVFALLENSFEDISFCLLLLVSSKEYGS